MVRWIARHRHACLIASLAVLVAALMVVLLPGHSLITSELSLMQPRPNPPHDTQAEIARRFGASPDSLIVLLRTESEPELIDLSHQVAARLREALKAEDGFTTLGLASALRKPEKILVEWDGGWTVVPGIAHLWGVRLRGQQKPIQWYAEIESVRVGCQLLPLFFKTFHARSVRGRGLDFRLRQRLDPGEADEHAEEVPPIPGFSDRQREVPADDVPEKPKRGNPWLIALDDIAIEEVETLWLDQYRFTGDGRLSGSFQFEIRGPLEVDRARLTVAGDLMAGDEQVARQLEIAIEAMIEPVVPKENKGAAFFRSLTTTVRLEAPQANLGFIDSYFRGASWLGLDGTGEIDVEVTLDRGVLATGSRVTAEKASFAVDYLSSRASGDGRLEGTVQAGGRGIEAVIEAELASFDLRGRGASKPHVRGSGLTFRISSPDLDLTETEPTYSMVLDLPSSEVTDLDFYNSYLPPGAGLELLSGEATIAGHLELSTADDRGSGDVELRGKQIRARFGDLYITGDLLVATHLADADVETRWFDLSGSRMTLDRVAIGDQRGTWWAHFELPEGNVRWSKPLGLDVRGTAKVRDSRPIIALVAQKKLLLRWMKPLLAVQDLELALGLRSNDDVLSVEDFVLIGKGLEVRADLELVDRTARGFVFFDRGPLSAGLELTDGERDWKLRHARRWYEEQTGHSTRSGRLTQAEGRQ